MLSAPALMVCSTVASGSSCSSAVIAPSLSSSSDSVGAPSSGWGDFGGPGATVDSREGVASMIGAAAMVISEIDGLAITSALDVCKASVEESSSDADA